MSETDKQPRATVARCQGCGEASLDLSNPEKHEWFCGVCGAPLCRECDARYGVCSAYECQKAVDLP